MSLVSKDMPFVGKKMKITRARPVAITFSD